MHRPKLLPWDPRLPEVRALPWDYRASDGFERLGSVAAVAPNCVRVSLCGLMQGSTVAIEGRDGRWYLADVKALEGATGLCAPLGSVDNVAVGCRAFAANVRLGCFCGPGNLGRSVDAWGSPPGEGCVVRTAADDVNLADRVPVCRPLVTGVAALDGLCTLGVGQRIALLAGAGVGKTTLLRRIASTASLDVHVAALIGERAREAAETVAALRTGGSWQRTTVVCATADTPPAQRLAALRTALAQAEWFCERGFDVLLTVDSITRAANAWRELALAWGERPAHRGHPPSLTGMLAAAVERAGARRTGSITAIFSVLVDADDAFEPITDILRGLLDGHIVLARRLAEAGRFPPVDVLRSSSRIMTHVVPPSTAADAAIVRRALAALERAEDLFAIGAYVPGGDPFLDAAVELRPELEDWLFGSEPARDTARRVRCFASRLRASTTDQSA
jgi:flagellum-specific ATP synthase